MFDNNFALNDNHTLKSYCMSYCFNNLLSLTQLFLPQGSLSAWSAALEASAGVGVATVGVVMTSSLLAACRLEATPTHRRWTNADVTVTKGEPGKPLGTCRRSDPF